MILDYKYLHGSCKNVSFISCLISKCSCFTGTRHSNEQLQDVMRMPHSSIIQSKFYKYVLYSNLVWKYFPNAFFTTVHPSFTVDVFADKTNYQCISDCMYSSFWHCTALWLKLHFPCILLNEHEIKKCFTWGFWILIKSIILHHTAISHTMSSFREI